MSTIDKSLVQIIRAQFALDFQRSARGRAARRRTRCIHPGGGLAIATGKGTWRLALGDLNADGKADVAASNLESNSLV